MGLLYQVLVGHPVFWLIENDILLFKIIGNLIILAKLYFNTVTFVKFIVIPGWQSSFLVWLAPPVAGCCFELRCCCYYRRHWPCWRCRRPTFWDFAATACFSSSPSLRRVYDAPLPFSFALLRELFASTPWEQRIWWKPDSRTHYRDSEKCRMLAFMFDWKLGCK